jgi:hypothetical protein
MTEKRISKTGVGFLIDASAKTYETLEKQLREFLSNSLDAGADKVVIEILSNLNKIIITDNGQGMTEEEFDNNYLVIGCSNKYKEKDTIGRIGVGKFSSIPLSDNLTIRTKKAGQENVYQASLNLKLLKDPNNRTEDISKLVLGDGEYVSVSVEDPNEDFSSKGCFSKISMSGVPQDIINKFDDTNEFNLLCRKLGSILPLEYCEESEAMKKLKRQDLEIYNQLMECSAKKKLNVTIKTQNNPEGIKLYRSLFGDDFDVTGEQIAGDLYVLKSPDEDIAPIKIIGFLADMSFGKKEYAKWKGINVRVQNTTVVENCFFEHNDPPPDARITGEIHILNSNEEELITMNRASFVTSYEQYKDISDWLTLRLTEFATLTIRRRSDFNSLLKKRQNKLKNQKIVSESIESSVLEGFSDVIIDMEKLSKNELKQENEIDELEEMKNDFEDLVCEIIPVPDSTQDNINSTIIGDKYSLAVPKKFFDYEAEIQGTIFKIKYVTHDKKEPVIDVDNENKVIRVNKNSAAIKNGSHSMVMSYILLELAFVTYDKDVDTLKSKIYELLKLAFS